MRKHSTRVRSALSLAGALFGVAPAAAARKFVARTGHPIPFRVELPEDAEIEEGPGLLSARTRDLSIVAAATDMLAGEAHPQTIPEAGSRRILTSLVMGSDALLFGVLEEELQTRKLKLEEVVRGIGTLGGQRAACLQGSFEEHGVRGWLDIHATVKDGILYLLAFAVAGGPGSPPPLFTRIRESFVLPQA